MLYCCSVHRYWILPGIQDNTKYTTTSIGSDRSLFENPFRTDNSEDMVTALTLEPLPIWEGSFGVVSTTLKLAAMLSVHRPANHVRYPGATDGQLKRQLAKKVLSEKNKQVAEAEQERKKTTENRKSTRGATTGEGTSRPESRKSTRGDT